MNEMYLKDGGEKIRVRYFTNEENKTNLYLTIADLVHFNLPSLYAELNNLGIEKYHKPNQKSPTGFIQTVTLNDLKKYANEINNPYKKEQALKIIKGVIEHEKFTEKEINDKTEEHEQYLYSVVDDLYQRYYPRKQGKAKGIKKAIEILKSNKITIYDLEKSIKNYAEEVKDREEKYVKHFSTFMNGDYLDFINVDTKPQTKQNNNTLIELVEGFIEDIKTKDSTIQNLEKEIELIKKEIDNNKKDFENTNKKIEDLKYFLKGFSIDLKNIINKL